MTRTRRAHLASWLLLLAPALGAAQTEAPPPVLVAALDDAALDAQAVRFFETLAAAIDQRGADASAVRGWFGAELAALVPEAVVQQILTDVAGPGDVRLERLRASTERAAAGEARSYRYLLVQERRAHFADLALDRAGKALGFYVGTGARRMPRAQLVEETQALSGEWGLAALLLDAHGAELGRVELGRAKELVPLGSTFKLYVLAELARRVTAGELSMRQELPIREELKSLPGGVLHERATGTLVTLDELAEKMIALSDNTATDHLIELLGREAIEGHLAEYENSDPARNTPFLKTLDMFVLKGLSPKRRGAVFADPELDAVAEAWKAGSPDERRAWLAAVHAAALEHRSHEKLRGVLLTSYGFATTSAPKHLEIEWFARPTDIVALLADAERRTLVDPATSELFLEYYGRGAPHYPMPGVRAHGFKGGSETGLLVLSSRIAMDDGRVVLACFARFGFAPTDATIAGETVGIYNDWIRNLLEGDPPAAAGG